MVTKQLSMTKLLDHCNDVINDVQTIQMTDAKEAVRFYMDDFITKIKIGYFDDVTISVSVDVPLTILPKAEGAKSDEQASGSPASATGEENV